MSKEYLDKAGATYIVSKVKELVGTKADTSSLKTVATTGNYDDLTGKPTIPTTTASVTSGSTAALTSGGAYTALNAKAPLASPALTGTPTAPTATAGTNSTQIATTAFVKTAVTNAVGSITGITFSKVDSLPATGTAGTIYLMSHSHGTNDIFDEYVYVEGAWEKIGNTDIDLSGYVQSTDLVAITNTEIDAMFS